MLRKVAIALAVILVAVAGVVAALPSSFAIERSTVVAAPADVVYAHIHSLRAMDAWSPWARMDPEMQITYEGPESGVGARSSWRGPQMGEGRLTITAVEPAQQVEMRLDMLSPMEGTNRVLFTLAPADGATRVRWRMEGHNGFVGKAIGLVMDMDEMVGGEFQRGLASLKTLAEAEAARRAAM